jgi:hypothetical protein
MKVINCIIVLFLFHCVIIAQPKSGDVFREYSWTTPPPSKPGQEPYLRVCGDGFYEDQTRKGNSLFNEGYVQDGWLTLPDNIDLKDAVRAEVVVEKMLCHDGSTGLAIKFNKGQFIVFPEAKGIPEPQEEYLHHIYPIINLPLSDLMPGAKANKFRFTIDSKQRWGMPQNMVYGMILRIYYNSNKPHAEGKIASISNGDDLGQNVKLSIDSKDNIKRVDYIGNFEDLNMEGDGLYKQWHYKYFKGELTGHIGSTIDNSFVWNTEWVPDQETSVQLAARITDENGMIYMTPIIDNLKIKRNYKVELCKPYDIPRRWATREHEFQSAFDIKGNVNKAEKFRIVATTWSPGYMNGLYLNNWLLMDRESCKYCFHIIDKVIEHPEWLQSMNEIRTGYTPLVKGKMTHGTEIQYPGFMILVRYKVEE